MSLFLRSGWGLLPLSLGPAKNILFLMQVRKKLNWDSYNVCWSAPSLEYMPNRVCPQLVSFSCSSPPFQKFHHARVVFHWKSWRVKFSLFPGKHGKKINFSEFSFSKCHNKTILPLAVRKRGSFKLDSSSLPWDRPLWKDMYPWHLTFAANFMMTLCVEKNKRYNCTWC